MSTRLSRASPGLRLRSLFLLPALLGAGLATAAGLTDEARHYDARAALAQGRALSVPDQLRSQSQTPPGLSADVQEFSAVEVDEVTGAVRSLSSQRGFLSAATPGKPMDIAMDFVRRNLAAAKSLGHTRCCCAICSGRPQIWPISIAFGCLGLYSAL